jgi:UDP-GlcNAc:undecaprenyl-phosphate/decaprenyl-phosphate GlcNAc-1-phosphate transferase
VLAWFCMDLAHENGQVLPPISIAWILALPVIDTIAQFFRRMAEGRHPFEPDRGHFHHHFIHAGIPTGESVYVILSLAFVLGAIGYLGAAMGLPQFVLTIGWVLLLASHIVLSRKPDIYIRIFKRLSR